jgi:5-(carboxyamino)imidazole ribonucleotide synthase
MRPHNTGHWSIDGADTSQFENHLRAVADLPLGSPASRENWSVMANVLGGPRSDLASGLIEVLALDPAIRVHFYGKSWVPGRKLGHVTAVGADLDETRARARAAADLFMGVPAPSVIPAKAGISPSRSGDPRLRGDDVGRNGDDDDQGERIRHG